MSLLLEGWPGNSGEIGEWIFVSLGQVLKGEKELCFPVLFGNVDTYL